MALTSDVKTVRVGAEGRHDPIAAPLTAAVTVYSGSIALLNSSGYLKNSSSPASTDTIIGIVGGPSAGTFVKTGPGITGGVSNGDVWVECLTGVFVLASGTGGDALTEATAGTTVYVVNETTVGATNGGGTRPVAGTQLPIDPTLPAGFVAVKLAGLAG